MQRQQETIGDERPLKMPICNHTGLRFYLINSD